MSVCLLSYQASDASFPNCLGKVWEDSCLISDGPKLGHRNNYEMRGMNTKYNAKLHFIVAIRLVNLVRSATLAIQNGSWVRS